MFVFQVLFQYLTAPHCCAPHEEFSISDLFETITSSENFCLDSISLFTFGCDKFLAFTKLIIDTDLSYQLKNNLVQCIIQYIRVVPSEELKLILFEQWNKNSKLN